MSRVDKQWQLLKVNARLACPDGGGAWRDNLLAQQKALAAHIKEEDAN